jgi:2-dehydropantoate 2-reductase
MPSYVIVGAGGIGCAVGYALRAAGASVIFVDADAEKVRWGRSQGVCVDRRPPQQADFQSFRDWTPTADVPVLLCTKCYDNATVLDRLPSTTTLIPIQNGFDQSLEARGSFPEGIASFVSECYPHRTHTRVTRAGKVHLGMHPVASSDQSCAHLEDLLNELVALLHRGGLFRVQRVSNILPYKHTKLMYNAAIGPLAAAAGLDNGQLLSVRPARRLFFELLRENYSILHAAGVPLGRIGPFHPDTVNRILQQASVARLLSWAFYPSLRGTYCSMHADLPAGRTEIEYYNRYLIDLAGERPCPLNRRVYELIKHMERDGTLPNVRCLELLAESLLSAGIRKSA